MSHNNRRFLAADSPHNHHPLSDNNHLGLAIVSAFVFFLVFVTLIYNLIRKLTHNSPSTSPHQPHHNLPPDLLRALPVFVYDKQNKSEESEAACAICLGDYESGQRLRTLPCDHVFHCACIDKWLHESGLCPVCRRVAVNIEQGRVENAQRCSERLMATYVPTRSGPALI